MNNSALCSIAMFLANIFWSNQSAAGVTNNFLYFLNGNKGYFSGSYDIDDYRIPRGQGGEEFYLDPLIKSSAGAFNFKFGLSRSSEVAKWFNLTVDATRNSDGANQSYLNFAFIGTLSLVNEKGEIFKFQNIALAYTSSERWVIGGKNCQYVDGGIYTNRVICQGRSSTDGRQVKLSTSIEKNFSNGISVSIEQVMPGNKSFCRAGYVGGVKISSYGWSISIYDKGTDIYDMKNLAVFDSAMPLAQKNQSSNLLLSQALKAQVSGQKIELYNTGKSDCGENSTLRKFDQIIFSVK